ncbi:MAG: uroporphyrinogen decarboxylase family protein [Thermincola sp.]|nr:uroporphyrinogen decarboxylase family protein [Thermincola sp.]MDT3703290.1 uroporphyrinogen decarboxylase family protein [Thermincola sp.]
MSNMLALAQERTQLFRDLFESKIPKRVPVTSFIAHEFAIQYAGQDLTEAQWDIDGLEPIFNKTCQDFYSDLLPVSAFRLPSFYKILGSKNFVMGSNGFLQHPEVEGLAIEDYDAFIASPFDCIVEKVLPKLYANLDTDSASKAMVMAKAFKAFSDDMGNVGAIYGRLIQKFGYGFVNLFSGFCEAPFDIITDQLRGFKNISIDVRRIPDKVEAAVEAALPLMIKMGTPPVISPDNATFIPLHMAPYLRDKDFEKLYWPTFKKLVEGLKAIGMRSYLFVENDWMRYLDYLAELPEGTVMMFEYGDPKMVKEKLGKKHIIGGFYPVSLLKTGTKEQCVDKAKELIDILAPGGRYFFSFDKVIITLDSANVENTKAVLNYMAQNANY